MDGPVASDLQALDPSYPELIEFVVVIRNPAIIWINDIETDAKNRSWPPTVYDLLQSSLPKMVRSIRKKRHNQTKRPRYQKASGEFQSLFGSDSSLCLIHGRRMKQPSTSIVHWSALGTTSVKRNGHKMHCHSQLT